MKTNSIFDRFQAAKVLIRESGVLALEWFTKRDKLSVEKKGAHDWVTEADHQVEMYIKERLKELFPTDSFFGEESGFVKNNDDGIWVVDPIDGTTCFLMGMSSWCVSIAFVVKKNIEIGLIYAPCSDELFAVQRGSGATINGNPLKPSKANSLSDGIVAIGYSPRQSIDYTKKAFEYLFNEGGVYHEIGSAALMIAYVAAGRYIGFYEYHLNSWDCLSGIAMVREIGGWTNDFLAHDGLYNGNPVIASAPGTKKSMMNLFSFAGHKI